MSNPRRSTALLDRLGLTEYESTALEHLLSLGRTTAPDLAEATGIPKARIYGVLESLADEGFVEVIPGRPKAFQPKAPDTILDRAIENRRQSFESFREEIETIREDFVSEFGPRYERASEEITPTEELFHVVDVGEPSETETRKLYHEAEEDIAVITKSFEYFDAVEPEFRDAIDRGITVRVLFLHPTALSSENREIQNEIVDRLESEYPAASIRYSTEKLPWRGTIVDPSLDYDTGKGIVLVEEEEIPLSMRQAAITENASFVAGLKRYFDLVWNYESSAPDEESPGKSDLA